MLKKYQTDSHVIYGTLRLEIFIKYPLITRESRLFAEIRIKKNRCHDETVIQCAKMKMKDYFHKKNNNLEVRSCKQEREGLTIA